MKTIREALLQQYVGAITIGFLLALGISNFVSTTVQCIAGYWEFRHRVSNYYYAEHSYAWSAFAASFIAIALYLLIAYMLMRWLYKPQGSTVSQTNVDEL